MFFGILFKFVMLRLRYSSQYGGLYQSSIPTLASSVIPTNQVVEIVYQCWAHCVQQQLSWLFTRLLSINQSNSIKCACMVCFEQNKYFLGQTKNIFTTFNVLSSSEAVLSCMAKRRMLCYFNIKLWPQHYAYSINAICNSFQYFVSCFVFIICIHMCL